MSAQHRLVHRADAPAFDDEGMAAASSPFQYPLDEPEAAALAADDATRLRQETVCRLLALVTDGQATDRAVGRRALLLACLLGKITRRELRLKMGVSRQRAHRLLTRVREQMPALARFSR